MNKNTKQGLVIAAAMAALFTNSALAADKAEKKEAAGANVQCEGVNECKGKGACGGANHGCAGNNECKGKGWISLSEKDCKAKGGKVAAAKK